MKTIKSVDEKMNDIKNELKLNKRVSFFGLFKEYNKPNLVVTFLAILELMKVGKIRIEQEQLFDDIVITAVEKSEEQNGN